MRRSARINEGKNSGAIEGGENIDPNTNTSCSSSPNNATSSATTDSPRSPLTSNRDDTNATNNGSAPVGGGGVEEQEGEGQVDDVLPKWDELVELVGDEDYANNLRKAQKLIQNRQKSGEDSPGFLPTYYNSRGRDAWKKKLGTWAGNQRTLYHNNELSAERIKVLELIGFVWSDPSWDVRFAELVEFKNQNGHCIVLRSHKNKKLVNWVKDQRRKCVDADRRKLLDGLGFAWNVSDQYWSDMFEQLEAYKKEHLDCNVPRNYDKNPELGTWVHNQRTKCKDANRRDKLTAIGFVWQFQRKKKWNQRNKEAQEQNVTTIKTSTTVKEAQTRVEQVADEMKKLDDSTTVAASIHFASVLEDRENGWGFTTNNHEEQRTIVKTSQAHYMTREKKRLIPGKDVIFFYLLRDDDGKLLFAVLDGSGKFVEVEVEGGVSLSNCLKHCKSVQEERPGKILVCLSIQLMTPGSTDEAKKREEECQKTLWDLSSSSFIPMNAKRHSSGISTKGAYGHIALMNILFSLEECVEQHLFTSSVPQDSKLVLKKKFPKLKFHDWPKSKPRQQDPDALNILQVTHQGERTVFKGKIFVITGQLHRLNQDTVKEAITARGGIVLKDFSPGDKNCYLILGGGNPSERKQADAKANEGKILKKDKFLALVKEKKDQVKEESEEE